MGIMYVNPSRRGRKRLRVAGHAKVSKRKHRRRHGGAKKRKGRMPPALAAYWKSRRGGKKKSRRTKRSAKRRGGHKKKRKHMARRRKRRARKSAPRRRRRRARRASPRRRRRKSHKRRRRARRAAPRRRRSRRRSHKRRRRSRRRSHKRRRRARKSATHRIRRRRRRRSRRATVLMYGGKAGMPATVRMNPRRRRKRRYGARRRRSRLAHRRYSRRHYRKNPGGMLIDLAKRAAPVLIGLYGSRLLVSKLGPKIPGVSNLGTFQGPALAIGAVLFTNWITKKVGRLAKYRNELVLGTALQALDTLVSAYMPASVKSMIGVGDVYDRAFGEYVQMPMGEYIHAGGGASIDESSMGEYVAVGAEEELGLDEELGAMEELGGDFGEGVSQSAQLQTVPQQPYLTPVPDRSYTRQIEPASAAFANNRDSFHRGIFSR